MEAAVAHNTTDGSKLKIDKFADGAITCLKLIGTIDEQFEGKKLAASLKGGVLILDLGEISKITSFGIREWVDFITAVGQKTEQIVLIECAPKVVDQLNMVQNFAGKGRVFSFYAPYRCDYCDADRRLLLQVDRDFDAIKSMKPPERPCQNCGNPEYFDEDPTTFFSQLAQQPKFELEGTVASFLAAKLNYAVSDSARRLRIDKHIEGRSTYLKIIGDLDGSFPREKLAEGQEGTIVLDLGGIGKIDPAGAAEWRGFLAMITPPTERIFLAGCPPMFLERLTKPEDLGPKAQVMSFAMPYSCAKCATTSSQHVDVEQHFDVLKFATPPEMKCPDCGGPTSCAASESLLSHLPTLAKPQIEPALRKFIKEAQERKPEKREMATTVAEAAAAGRSSSTFTLITAVVAAAVVAVAVVFGISWYNQKKKDEQTAKLLKARDAVGALKTQTPRPAWITSDTRASASCVEEGGGMACVGVSSYADTPEESRAEATDAALEEFANQVGLKIDDPTFGNVVRTLYGNSRQVALSTFEAAKGDSDGAKYDRARRIVREGRSAVAAALRKTGGAAVPAQPSAEHAEEYAAIVGDGSRFLSFVQFKFSTDQIKTLRARYSAPSEALGAKALTVFPGVAWRYAGITDGAILSAVGEGVIKNVGLSAQCVVLKVQDRVVADAATFANHAAQEYQRLKKEGGTLQFYVKCGDGDAIDFKVPITKVIADVPQSSGSSGSGSRGSGSSGGGVNIWDKTGGGNVRDNPNE
jgi:anti-anti-sigma regulatory factor